MRGEEVVRLVGDVINAGIIMGDEMPRILIVNFQGSQREPPVDATNYFIEGRRVDWRREGGWLGFVGNASIADGRG